MARHKDPRHSVAPYRTQRKPNRRTFKDTAEYPRVRLRPDEIGALLPSETLSAWAIQKFVHEQNWAPDSEDALAAPLDTLFATEISTDEWNAWEDDWDSAEESPIGSSDDWLNPNVMLQYTLARMESITDDEMFERQLRSLLRQYAQAFAVESQLTNGTIALIDVLFSRLYRCGIRLFVQREHHLALLLFQWLTLARPQDKRILTNIQQLSAIVSVV